VLDYAVEKNLFAKYGLDVTVSVMESGSQAVATLISGSAQLCQISGPAVVYGAVAGADVAIVGGLVNTYVYSLMVPASIRSPLDLQGKAVAISAPGSAADSAMRLALSSIGLRPGVDVTLLSIGRQGERMAAMEAGYVSGTLLTDPDAILARNNGFHALVDMSTMGLPDLHTGIVTTKAMIKSDRAIVVNFMKAFAESIFLIKSDKKATLPVMSKLFALDLHKDAGVLSETYEGLIKSKMVDIPYPSLEGVEALLAGIVKDNPDAARYRPEDIADPSIVHELEEEGFLRNLWQRK
jgi:NitT/TauT family transport system substrate-binding protein